MHRFTEITSAIPLPSIQKGEQPLNKKALRGLFFIYYISLKVGSPESRTQQLVRSRFWLAPFYVISKALTRPCNQTKVKPILRGFFNKARAGAFFGSLRSTSLDWRMEVPRCVW